jgi:5-(carboxyamino)imidazole ribonucleotide mutase
MSEGGPQVAIIMGSDSDLPVMREAELVLRELGVPCEVTIVSAHRTPERLASYARDAAARGIKLIIAGAGGAAHLPGMTAAFSELPVIGVPIKSKALSGVDSLHSIAQMPPGVPVGTMAIDGARNAGIYAAQILAAFDPALNTKLRDFRERMRQEVEGKAARLEAEGSDAYLNETAK